MSMFLRILNKNKENIDRHRQFDLINSSDYFDAEFYLSNNPDVANAGVDPVGHFLDFGGHEGRKPSRKFDSAYYLKSNEDVARSGVNPLVHYLRHGMHEGRQPLPSKRVGVKRDQAAQKSAGSRGDSALRLLQLQLLQGNYESFDWLLRELNDQSIVNDARLRSSLDIMQNERWLAEGQLSPCIDWLECNRDDKYFWFYKARLSLLEGNNEGAILAAQTFLYQNPASAEGAYLLADSTLAQGAVAFAREELRRFVARSGRARSWSYLARTVNGPESLQDYLALRQMWRPESPGARHNPDVVLATADACRRAGNLPLARQVIRDAIAFHERQKGGFKSLRQEDIRYSSHLNLPLWPQPFLSLPLDRALDGQRRMQQALGDLYRALGDVEERPFLVQHSLDACLHAGAAFDVDAPMTLGLSPDADAQDVADRLRYHPCFYSVEPSEGQLGLKHQNGVSLVMYLHRADGGDWLYQADGVCWRTHPVQTKSHQLANLAVWIPERPEEYQSQYRTAQKPAFDWVLQSRNRTIRDEEQYRLYCYRRLLKALIASDKMTETVILRELAKYEGVQEYRQLIGGTYSIPTADQIEDEGIQVVLYVSGLEKVGYQANMWIPILERLSVKAAIVIREKRIAEELDPTSLPIYFLEGLRDVELLEEGGVKTILYPANPQKNVQAMRLHRINHFFINHGESDKVVNQSKFLMAYDKLLVAGPLAEKRLRVSGLPVRDDQIVHVGRPQVELALQRANSPCRSINTVLYAPTWEGFVEEADYSSVNPLGLAMLERLLQSGVSRVLFKYHPYTGYNKEGPCGFYLTKMLALRERYPNLEVQETLSNIHDLMNESDLMISDISSVLNDYLYTMKPIVLMNVKGHSTEDLAENFPSCSVAYAYGPEDDIAAMLRSIAENDTKLAERQAMCDFSLGSFTDGSLATFDRVVAASVATASSSSPSASNERMDLETPSAHQERTGLDID